MSFIKKQQKKMEDILLEKRTIEKAQRSEYDAKMKVREEQETYRLKDCEPI